MSTAIEETISPALIEAKTVLREAGWYVKQVFRFFPPFDSGEEGVVIFLGRGYKDRGSCRPLTAYMPFEAGGEPLVSEGW